MSQQIPISFNEFLISNLSNGHTQISIWLYFVLSFFFFLNYSRILHRRISITHVVQVSFTSNTSQSCQAFFLKIFMSRIWYFSRNLFKDFFRLLFIGTTTPRKIVCQNIDPSFFEFNNDTNRNKINCIRIVCYGSSTTKCCCISWIIVFFAVGMQATH